MRRLQLQLILISNEPYIKNAESYFRPVSNTQPPKVKAA